MWTFIKEAINWIGAGTIIMITGYLINLYWKSKSIKILDSIFTKEKVKEVQKKYIPTSFKLDSEPEKNEKNLIPFLFKKISEGKIKYVFILSNSGMGKTIFMIGLYLKYRFSWVRFKKRYDIELLSMRFKKEESIDEKIKKIEKDYNTILLLDGFEEDPDAIKDFRNRLTTIKDLTDKFPFVVITVRANLYPQKKDEPNEQDFEPTEKDAFDNKFLKLYISPFEKRGIEKYINKKIKIWDYKKRRDLKSVIENSFGLMSQPLLLSYIVKLPNPDQKNLNLSVKIFEGMIKYLIERESKNIGSNRKAEFIDKMHDFSKDIAKFCYYKYLSKKDLTLTKNEVDRIAQKHETDLPLNQFINKSLLVRLKYDKRNKNDDYMFIHRDIMEYFLSIELCRNPDFKESFDFNQMQKAKQFYEEMESKDVFEFLKNTNPGKKPALSGIFRVNGSTNRSISELNSSHSDYLEYLNLNNNNLSNISPLSGLISLRELELSYNPNINLNNLIEFKNLLELNLSFNQISDITNLKQLKKLKELNLSNNRIADIRILSELEELEELNLANNNITNIEPLKNLKNLKRLNLRNNDNIPRDQIEEFKERFNDNPFFEI